jgi:hypothetical protein
MNKIELVKKLKTYAPMIFDITLSEMGCEFTAVCKKGAIRALGMLLSSVTEGGIPFDDWAQGKQFKYEGNKDLEKFLDSTGLIVPWEDISLEELKSLLEGIIDC